MFLAEVRNAIFYLYGEKLPLMIMLPNFACGFPSPTYSFLPNFIVIALIVFWGADARKLGVPIDLKGDLYNS